MYKNIKISFITSLILLNSSNIYAQTNDVIDTITSDMEHYSEVATITKQNEHYQPYIISVFQGKELEKLGITNLKQALELVPGLDMATDNFNISTAIFRGSNPLAYGQSKLFIDEVLVNNIFFDAYPEYLSFPIEMIKRIEVVRGPGSKTDGVNAYAGSINVITYAEDFKGFETKDKLVFKYGSYDYKMGGFFKTFKTENLKVFIDFYYQQDNKKLQAGPDGLSQGVLSLPDLGIDNTALSQSGDAPLWLQEYSLGVNLEYKDFFLKTRILNHTQGSAYGINLALPKDDDRVKLPSNYLEIGYKRKGTTYDFEIKGGIKEDAFDSKSKLLPDGLKFIDTVTYDNDGTIVPVTFDDGVYGEHYAKQRMLYQSSYFKYKAIEDHIITIGYRYIKEETIEMRSKLSDWATGDAALVDYTKTYPFFDENAKRDTIVYSLQDQFTYSNSLSFIYGFNYEQTTYKDAGLEPRVSMVYQYDTDNIFKAMYSRSHRNPSWQEMFTKNNHSRIGSTDLDPERVEAYEFSYIRNFSSDTYLQSNIFYLANKDQISNSTANANYRNVVDTNLYGLELEYKGHITSSDQVYMNYSYVTGLSHINDEDRTEALSNIAHHLAKAYYIYNYNSAVAFSFLAKYIGAKERVSEDTRDKLKAYKTLDFSLRYKNIQNNYNITLSAKNIFDENVKYPSPPNTYVEDYTQEGRNFLISFVKEF